MKKQLIFWSPRILAVLYAMFISLFALDVFSEGTGFWQTVGALALHLIPTGIVVGLLVLSLRRERLGGALFVLTGIVYAIPAMAHLHTAVVLVIAGPLFAIGILFLLNGSIRAVRG